MLRWWTNGKVETAEMFTWKCNFSLLPIHWKPPTGQSLEKKRVFSWRKCSCKSLLVRKYTSFAVIQDRQEASRSDQFEIPSLVCGADHGMPSSSDQTWFTPIPIPSPSSFVSAAPGWVCVFWPKPFNIPSPTSNNSWHQLLLVNHREGQLTFVPESPGIPILDLALRPKIWTWHCRRIKSLLQYLPLRWEGKERSSPFKC